MKKIIFALCFLFMVQSFVFADEIIDSRGVTVPCKIETVDAGLVEYKKDGLLNTFVRENDSLIFNDYVDVREKLFKNDSVVRYSGKIITKDMWSTIIQNENGQIDIPFYRIKFVGVYKP